MVVLTGQILMQQRPKEINVLNQKCKYLTSDYFSKHGKLID